MKSLAAAVAATIAFAASGTAANAQISDDVVKIGVLTDMSSLYADATGKGSLAAVQMAVADYGGKVKGKPVEVISADHQNKPDVGVGIARNWYDNEKVDAIFDVPTSSVALPVSALTREKNKININSGGGSSDLTGVACSPNTVHWTYDTYALSNVAGRAMVKRGEDTWFFVTADYAFGMALERDAANVVKESGGKVLGNVRHPLNSSDFSSFLLQAQASKAKVVALANAGGDTTNALKQASEFGITKGGQKMIALLQEITDTHALGVKETQGLIVTDAFYWDMNDETRAFSKRFLDKVGHMPTMIQAGLYSATMHYLKAIEATGSDEAGDADQRFLRQGRQNPHRRPHGPRHVSIRGEEAGRVEGRLGSLQADRHRAWRRSVPSARQGRLPAGQDELRKPNSRSAPGEPDALLLRVRRCLRSNI
jgi:branched-chain amino acid transport system substrate-binding protein